MEEEKVKKLAELRELLEERAKNLEIELEGLRTLLDFLNDLLLEKSFKRIEEIAKPISPKATEIAPAASSPRDQAKAIPLKDGSGELLANLYVEDGSMRVIPIPDRKFDVNTPPFTAFLVEKILGRMHDADQEAVKRGEIPSNAAFSFSVERDGDIIREIVIRNVNPQRERELRSSIRWTLEKMHEKMRGTP